MKKIKSAIFLLIFPAAVLFAQQPPEPAAGRLGNDLNLSDSQKDKIEKVLDNNRGKMDRIRERTMKLMETLRDSTELISKETDKEILKVLTKEQAEKFKGHQGRFGQLAMMPLPAMINGNIPGPVQPMQDFRPENPAIPGSGLKNNQLPCMPGQNQREPEQNDFNNNGNPPAPDMQAPGLPNEDEMDSLIDMDLLDLLSIIE